MSESTYNDPSTAKVFKPPVGGFLDIELTLNWFAGIAFVCGLASARMVNLVGEIFVGELLIVQFAFLLLMLGRVRQALSLPAFGLFLQMAVVMLLGYMLADIYRDALAAQFLRGWARVILVTLDFAALVIVCAHDKRNLWWFVFGMALGALGQLVIRGVPISSPAGWKFGYSAPLVTLLTCMSCIMPMRFSALGFVALGVCNIVMDFRILGAICVAIGAILWIRSADADRFTGARILQLFGIGMLAACILGGTIMATQGEFAKRREQSNAGRSVSLSVAAWAIAESPLIGYGSWPTDTRLVNLYNHAMEQSGQFSPNEASVGSFSAHSQILQVWVEGGLLGVLFWIYYGFWLIRTILYVVLRRPADAYMPVFLFILIYDLWHLFMSAFSGPTRLPIALGVAVICVCAAELREARGLQCATLARR